MKMKLWRIDCKTKKVSSLIHLTVRNRRTNKECCFEIILVKQHYSGNRTRNAIVREDTPWAREEQKREEQHALEDRLRQLQLLQLQ